MTCKQCDKKPKQNASKQSVQQAVLHGGILPYVRARAAVCAVCEHNDSGTCRKQKEATPDKKCRIKIGIEKAETYCPEGRWQRHIEQEFPKRAKCTKCKGYSILSAEICKQCVNKLEVLRTNMSLGQESSTRVFSSQRGSVRANQLQKDMWDAVRNNPARPVRKSAFTALYDKTTLLTVQDLASDSLRLASLLPQDIKAVCGVARSGITPANIVATMLHLPLLAIRQTKGDVIEVGNGWRMGMHRHISTDKTAKVAIVDDTSMTGNSFKAIRPIAEKHFKEYVTGCLYVNPLSSGKPDVWVHDLPWPHLLEWNLFNSVLSPNAAVDFDGILCWDCAPWQDDDGENYIGFINNAVPKYLAKRTPIPLIVTARIEKYRKLTMEWLDRHGIKCNRLIMHPAKTLAQRNKDDIAKFKAKHFEEWARKHPARPKPNMFIESEPSQAKRINKITNRLVVCPSNATVYGDPRR